MWSGFLTHPWMGSVGVFLAVAWLSRLVAAAFGMRKIAEITRSEYDVAPADASGRVPRVSIIVPARNEAEHIEAALLSVLELDYPDYEVIAVDDRSEDATGTILDRLQADWRERGEALHHRLKVLHIHELPPGWLGKTHAMWQAGKQATGDWLLFTDADVVFRADALRRAVMYRRAGAGGPRRVVSDDGDGIAGGTHDDGVLSVAVRFCAPAVEGCRSEIARRDWGGGIQSDPARGVRTARHV